MSKCDRYRVPKTEDLFATLNKGEKFSKLDLSHAYQQLLLAPESRSLTVSNDKGLFQPRCLQSGVQSASGIFQREMESRLNKVPFVKVHADDRLVSGKSSSEDLENLESVFEIIKNNGLRLKLKNVFLCSQRLNTLDLKLTNRDRHC